MLYADIYVDVPLIMRTDDDEWCFTALSTKSEKSICRRKSLTTEHRTVPLTMKHIKSNIIITIFEMKISR